MNLPIEWLSEFVKADDIDIKKYCDEMTMSGSKVEGWKTLADDIENVVLGKIITIEKHPDSDHMVICMVDDGETELRQIVTGAQNVFEGAYVPVAKAPAKLPGGVVIKAGKLRGVLSNGMLCSISELGLTLNDMPDAIEDGIFILGENYVGSHKPGEDICDILGLRGNVVEFEITPNRPDCLSVIGLARETGVTFGRKVKYHVPEVKGSCGDISDYISVDVKNTELCPRYTARVVKNVKIAPSPLWLRMRLRAAGVRPINNIVDITNYVMLEYGQPMHAFDYSCLDGKKIIVRNASEGEKFVSLDDQPHTLSSSMLVIADEKKAVALAGVMGGANSEIKDDTTTVVFESDNFMGASVRITSRALGMRTESSGRFEKGLDPENTYPAVQRACELVEMLGAGEVCGGIIDVYGKKWEQTVLPLEVDRVNSLLGLSLGKDDMIKILSDLDFEIRDDKIYVPSFREDVKCMNDIAEEIIRIYGYNTVEATLFSSPVKTGEMTPMNSCRERANDMLTGLGLYESCTFSFISPKYYDKINMAQDDPRRKSLVISNPLGEDTSIMRTTLLPSVLEALQHNSNYHSEDVGLFENAAVYIPNEDATKLPNEPISLTIALYGHDFYHLKGIINALLETLGITDAVYTANRENPTYHPGRCADIRTAKGELLGVMGELHPLVMKNYDFDKDVYAAELDFEAVFRNSASEKKYTPLPKYPALSRDFAFVCDEELESGEVIAIMSGACPRLLEEAKLFDVYRGSQLPEGKKSMAFAITLRSADHTLSDEEADKAQKKILSAIENKLGLTLRT
ncbi:MAG: phenylalanine--tRNA ligase subunit beta [Firmicutes bacterium]|nr:phenylalanine--tRNA ligase subunit beta [Bacillota bacterium]